MNRHLASATVSATSETTAPTADGSSASALGNETTDAGESLAENEARRDDDEIDVLEVRCR